MTGLAAIKQAARLAIQGRMGEPCSYSNGVDPSTPTLAQQAAGLGLTVRFHTKTKVNLSDHDGLTVLEPIEKLVFNATELDALGLTLEQGSEITIPGYGVTLVLDSELDPDGPENVYWTVTRA